MRHVEFGLPDARRWREVRVNGRLVGAVAEIAPGVIALDSVRERALRATVMPTLDSAVRELADAYLR